MSEKIAWRLKCKLHVYKVRGCEPGVLFFWFISSNGGGQGRVSRVHLPPAAPPPLMRTLMAADVRVELR